MQIQPQRHRDAEIGGEDWNLNFFFSSPRLSPRLCVSAVAFILITFLLNSAQAQTTQPDDPPVSPAMAPMYLSIGRQLCLRLDIMRRTVDELNLTPDIAPQADQLIDTARKQIADLMNEIKNGPMPSDRLVRAIPPNLRAARDHLYALIGPAQTQKLQQMLQSLRGETRENLGRLRLMLADLHLPDDENQKCRSILSDADAQAESLPQTTVQGDAYDQARQKMTDLLTHLHDRLCTILTAPQRQQLGPAFAQYASPATRPN
jgi:hypothetical protein